MRAAFEWIEGRVELLNMQAEPLGDCQATVTGPLPWGPVQCHKVLLVPYPWRGGIRLETILLVSQSAAYLCIIHAGATLSLFLHLFKLHLRF